MRWVWELEANDKDEGVGGSYVMGSNENGERSGEKRGEHEV